MWGSGAGGRSALPGLRGLCEVWLMALNVSRGNMFPWVTHTWNPRAGVCSHGCLYCFMLDRPCDKYRGPPRLEKSEMRYPLGRDRVIFVGSASDLFARDVPDDVIRAVLERCRMFDGNTYHFQTKNPGRLFDFLDLFPEDATLGTTIETNRVIRDVSSAPDPLRRYQALRDLSWPRKMVSVEPVIAFDVDVLAHIVGRIGPEFVSIGADSKGRLRLHGIEEPGPGDVKMLVRRLRGRVPDIKLKANLDRILQAEVTA